MAHLPTLRVLARTAAVSPLTTASATTTTRTTAAATTTVTIALSKKPAPRAFSASARRQATERNRIFTPIRSAPELSNAQLLASATNRPLITLWTTSWCSTCRQVAPLIDSLVAQGVGGPDPVGQSSNGVAFAEVEADAPDMVDTTSQYVLNSVPTLMTFVNQELVEESVVRDGRKITNEAFLREWIEGEARRGPAMAVAGGGGSWFSKLFGGGSK